MSTNSAGKKLNAYLNRQSKNMKSKNSESKGPSETSDGHLAISLPVPNRTTVNKDSKAVKQGTSQRLGSNLGSATHQPRKDRSKSELDPKKEISKKTSNRALKREEKKKHTKFSEASGVNDQVLRSPSRLGYSEDIPQIIESTWENTSQDSNREDFQLDLKGISVDQDRLDSSKHPDIETKETGQQTDFPLTPSSSARQDKPNKSFVTSHKFLNENPGASPKHPYEKTVFFVKTPRDNKLVKEETVYNHSVTSSPLHRPVSSYSVVKSNCETTRPLSFRADSGYASRQETLQHTDSSYKPVSATSAKTVSNKSAADILRLSPGRTPTNLDKSVNGDCKFKTEPASMSYYITDNYSPISSARKQEKEDLQQLNERFGNYVQKVRVLSEQSNRLDSNAFIKQTRILEEEMANLKTMYERELDALRQDLNATHREGHNYQVQCEKNKQAAIDFETRLSVEVDKSRRLIDDNNLLQQKVSNLEAELMGLRQAGDGRGDFQGLQREMDKIIRENEDHKHRQEQASLLRADAEDRCHTLTKKLEFNEQVHAQQISELRERLEQSQATIISLESRVREASKVETAMPDVLKQVRDQAEMELKRFRLESEENYSRNISALKCQMDNDANTIERLTNDKAILQGQIGELAAKIRTLEGQVITLEHQRSTAEQMIEQERSRSAAQIHEMEKKIRDMHEMVFEKMREAGTTRDLHLPLKAEIEALKVLLEEEERRLTIRENVSLQSPLSSTTHVQTTYTPPVPISLPVVSSGPNVSQQYQLTSGSQVYTSGAQNIYTSGSQNYTSGNYNASGTQNYTSGTQHISPLESPFITQSAVHNQYTEQVEQQEPLFTHVTFPSEPATSQEYIGTSRYTYETTPSVNRLHIDNPPRNSPRVVGPISRAKSAPVQRGQNVALVPTNLGQGKDYFDEMFKDLTRETLYTQTRPKSSPIERPPSGTKPPSASGERVSSAARDRPASRERPPSAARERPPSRERPSSRTEIMAEVLQVTPRETTENQPVKTTGTEPERRSPDRPHSSVFHDYTTSTSSAVGDIKILEVNQEGRFVRIVNEGKQELEFGGYMIQQNVGGHPVAVFRFPPRTKFVENSTITVWSGATEQIEHQPPKNFVWKEQHKWGTGPECTTILCKPNGQAIAWMTAAHRFTKNPYDETQDPSCPSEDDIVQDTGIPTKTQEELLTEMNVNLNEPKPDPVYLRREKQSPPSLIAQKHPHGTSTGKDTHPQMGQPRPFTYGNDNSSVNRQSRVQSTRPDPIPGQPYAGGSANRIGSAPLKKFTGTGTGTAIRGSGAIANRSSHGVTSPPPTAFQAPHNRFESGMEQIQSQHHVDFLPPMPRPPLFSTW